MYTQNLLGAKSHQTLYVRGTVGFLKTELTHLDGSGVPTSLLDLVFPTSQSFPTLMWMLFHQSARPTIYLFSSLAPHQRKPTKVVSKVVFFQENLWQNGQFVILLQTHTVRQGIIENRTNQSIPVRWHKTG